MWGNVAERCRPFRELQVCRIALTMPFPLAKLLDDVVQLCPLPATTKRVVELADSDRASMGDIARAIQTDPALATAVLRVANSALFAGMKVSQLEAAVVRIGLRELKSLASAMSVLAAFRSKDPVQTALQERSVLAGSVANKFAKASRLLPPSTASTIGLLSEVGAMACLAVDGKEYIKLWKEVGNNHAARAAREMERYTLSSFEIGQHFLERNSVPDEIATAVGAQLGVAVEAQTPAQRTCLIGRHSAEILLAGGDEPQTTAALDELAKVTGLVGMDGAGLYDLFLREGLLRDLARK